jgi:hypothetical protein
MFTIPQTYDAKSLSFCDFSGELVIVPDKKDPSSTALKIADIKFGPTIKVPGVQNKFVINEETYTCLPAYANYLTLKAIHELKTKHGACPTIQSNLNMIALFFGLDCEDEIWFAYLNIAFYAMLTRTANKADPSLRKVDFISKSKIHSYFRQFTENPLLGKQPGLLAFARGVCPKPVGKKQQKKGNRPVDNAPP